MSTPKIIRAAQSLLRQVSRMAHGFGKALVSWLLRGLFVVGRQPLLSKAGFVLPTTVLLLLVVVLTVGAISYRTFTRTQQSITGRQQQVIYNAATPVIDRAKSKIEFLFDPNKDPRGTTITPQPQLLSMMLNDGENNTSPLPVNPYDFDGETRIDVNGDGTLDNAWRYRVDLDGDGVITQGKDGTAVYSIIFTAPADGAELRDARTAGWQTRANRMEVRNAPLSNASQSDNICERNDAAGVDQAPLVNGQGWFPDQINPTKIRKNFQVSAYVVPDNPSAPIATLEFQQDREATQGFKWAAWFRNDLEIFPGPAFSWNGAMHTEGSLIVGGSSDKFHAFLVSSKRSCINDKGASEITVKQNEQDQPKEGTPAFKGRFIAGTIRDNNFTGSANFDIGTDNDTPNTVSMGSGNDSLAPGNLRPIDFSLEPVKLQTEGLSIARNPAARPVTAYEDGTWNGNPLHNQGNSRLFTDAEETTPYVDDTFRADNRWGPKPTWGPRGCPIGRTTEDCDTTPTARIGEEIAGITELTGADPQPGQDSDSVGLDGYWERRARVEGLRLIVGQRLELGDPAGWGGPGGQGNDSGNDAPITGNSVTSALNNSLQRSEPLRPWRQGCSSGNSCNEERQRRTLWDNLAAVQATAVYHNATDGSAEQRDFPDACLITTVHPGTPTTLDRSATFEDLAYGLGNTNAIPGYTNVGNPLVITDVFRGRGTNGWEFDVPTVADFRNTNSSLMKALTNLATYAGDPNGGAPSFRVNQIAGQPVHPYPSMAMWGDFSMLRRVLQEVNEGGYDNLSPADKTTLHTAGCMMGMLAYNIDYLEKLDINAINADPALKPLLGYTDTEVVTAVTGTTPPPGTGINLTANAGIIADERYSDGLRGRIRVIDHLVQSVITPPEAQTIFAANRPPVDFVNSLANMTLATMSAPPPAPPNPVMQLLAWDSAQSNNPETYVRLLERWRDALPVADTTQRDEMNRIISLAQLIVSKEQVARDRTWGFLEFADFPNKRFYSTPPLGDCGMTLDGTNRSLGWLSETPVTLTTSTQTGSATNRGPVQPDPLGRLCSARPRYPILFSLFPARLTDFLTPPATVDAGYAGGFIAHGDIDDPTVAQAVRDAEDRQAQFANYILSENGGLTYAVIKPEDIKLNPLTLSQGGATLGGVRRSGGGGAWVLPTAVSPVTAPTPNNNQFNLIKVCSGHCSQPQNANSNSFQLPVAGNALVRVAFKDGAFYNGREMMPVRTLDLDLDLMRSTAYQSDLWLPERGIIYAFREDAVSESHIVRPPTISAWSQCNEDAKLQTATCQMNTATRNALQSTDPPVNPDNGISTKPVDYYPDPDRRPYGFRLRQGANLSRAGDEGRGLSLISDNPVYVQGDFNLHQKGGTQLEEFAEPLQFNADGSYDKASFYGRRNLDLRFATREGDDWRPSEIVADAVTLLSSNFCDGSIQDGFDTFNASQIPAWLRGRYGCGNSTVTSFLNQNRPNQRPSIAGLSTRGVLWERANMIDSLPRAMVDTRVISNHNVDEGESPIFISRSSGTRGNSRPIHWRTVEGQNQAYNNGYLQTRDDKALIPASENRMNMIMVSGLVPSRLGQPYGGLHNFPRFIENWAGRNLNMSGAFLQLSFSSYATAPFDQEAWQPGAPAPTTGDGKGNQWIRYYEPPNRRWGYDVGLQYAPSGPVAQRFQFAEDTRSEFYTEPPADDPYIRNLCLQAGVNVARCPE